MQFPGFPSKEVSPGLVDACAALNAARCKGSGRFETFPSNKMFARTLLVCSPSLARMQQHQIPVAVRLEFSSQPLKPAMCQLCNLDLSFLI